MCQLLKTKKERKMMMAEEYFNSRDARFLINEYEFSIFPVHGINEEGECTCGKQSCDDRSKGKHPATLNGLVDGSKDIKEVKKLWARRKYLNVGIVTGKPSNISVIDVDSDAALETLKEILGEEPVTFTVKTGRGYHFYFQYEEGLRSRNNLLEGIDIKSDGGYVIGPASHHHTGSMYKFVDPFQSFAPFPKKIKDLMAAPIEKSIRTNIVKENVSNTALNLTVEEKIIDGRDEYMSNMIYASILNLTATLNRWPEPQEVFDDCWPVYSRKVAPRSSHGLEAENRGTNLMEDKIYSKLKSFKSGHIESFQSVEDIVKSHKPNSVSVVENIDPETGEVVEKTAIHARDISDIDLNNIPPRSWLFGSLAARKFLTIIGASPGAGKSIFTMQMAVCASSNKEFGPHKTEEPNIKTWIYNNEEGEEELRRRLKGILMHENIDPAQLGGRFYMNSGEDHSICIARRNLEDGGIVHTPDFDQLKEEVLRQEIDLLIVDPFAETHALAENNNDELKEVTRLYRRIAIECNCAVVLVHHTRKSNSNDANSAEQGGNADNLRGGGSQIGVARRVFTLSKMDKQTGKKLNVSDKQRRYFVRLDDAKSNISPPAEVSEWYKFKSISIGNGTSLHELGDNVGVLEHKTIAEIEQQEGEKLQVERILLLERLARVMIKNSISEASIRQLADLLFDDGYKKYANRKLREFIPECIQGLGTNTQIVSEGYECKFTISEGKTRKEGHKICLHMEEISCF